MSFDSNQPIPYAAPATAVPSRRPTVVTVMSIIIICFASLGVICSPFAILPYVTDFGHTNDPINAAIYSNTAVKVWTIFASVVGFVIAIGQIFAAAAALKMKEVGRAWLVRLAVWQLVLLVLGCCVTLGFLLPAIWEAGRANPGHDAAVMGGVIGGVAGSVLGAVLPALTIFFMKRPNVIDAFRHPSPSA